MTKRSIFAKIFLITFALFSSLVILLHASVYFIFPSTYIESQRQTILKKSEALAKSFQGQTEETIESVIDLYSKTNDIKVSIKGKQKQNAIEVKDDLLVNPDSQNNSLVIEERKIQTKEGKDLTLQFLATVDSQKEARDISLGFLPYSLLASFVLSLIASYLYARMISAPILEIKQMTKRMKRLDRTASLPIHSQDEIGVLKQQINDLYHHLLEVIDNLEQQKQENLKLEQMKVEFLRGASHELKTPLASLKIILENMRDKIGRYKDRDRYLSVSLDIVDEMNQIVLEILSLSSVQELAGDKEWIQLDQVLEQILDQYKVLAQSRSLTIDNQIPDKPVYMDPAILKLVLSNVISNAVKHSDAGGEIQLRLEEEGTHLAVENTSQKMVETAEMPMTASRQKKEGGLGLFVVQHLLDHEELAYQFDKTAMGLRFRMELPKDLQD
ncbi:sensor histidine kinase [Streptococcus koreensis]|uniref:histidine kinase n=1 Tax=Streptococcus koreensis TaxID=2382163 RepID=A0ABM6Z7I9_9STRE|nr:HAMP domain-containing sensor histidine kinase [Streptococcus koreensis]AYF93456.1 sensor histidine kinase [Streptococcus koreensis]